MFLFINIIKLEQNIHGLLDPFPATFPDISKEHQNSRAQGCIHDSADSLPVYLSLPAFHGQDWRSGSVISDSHYVEVGGGTGLLRLSMRGTPGAADDAADGGGGGRSPC